MPEGIPEITIYFDPATGYYGFQTRFPGQRVHYTINTFNSVEDVFGWCDPHRERIWEEASDADETKILISRDFKEGTVGWRMAHLTLTELGAVQPGKGSRTYTESERAGYALGPSNMRRASETLPLSPVRIIIVEIVSTVQKCGDKGIRRTQGATVKSNEESSPPYVKELHVRATTGRSVSENRWRHLGHNVACFSGASLRCVFTAAAKMLDHVVK